MINIMELRNECRLIINLSKLTNCNVSESMLLDIDWDLILHLASKNKVLSLLYNNLLINGMIECVPTYYRQIIEDGCSCNYIRNNEKLHEMKKLQSEMQQNSIPVVPVKGGYLIDNVYKDRKIRATNDVDILFKRKDIPRIDAVMKKNGYEYGEYDKDTNAVLPPDTKKKLLYKTKMWNLLPYVKVINEIPNKTVIFDFSFALDFSLDTKPVEEMLDNAIQKDIGLELLPEHFLVHMCCHHYREASNVAWILIGKDLNLIKFCDVREFIHQKMDSDSIKRAISFAKKHDLEKAFYFTVYFTREIYNDGYETEILNALGIVDESFLYQFGEKDYDELQTRKKDFWTSLFADDNKDEIVQEPKYKNLI